MPALSILAIKRLRRPPISPMPGGQAAKMMPITAALRTRRAHRLALTAMSRLSTSSVYRASTV